jgi:hypothetical protein
MELFNFELSFGQSHSLAHIFYYINFYLFLFSGWKVTGEFKLPLLRVINVFYYSSSTDYGLDCPGSNPGGDEIFRTSRLALGPTQPNVKWVTGLSRGVGGGG